MRPRTALGLAIACAAAAVGIVAADVELSVEVALQREDGGEWRTVASSSGGRRDWAVFDPHPGACAAGGLRVVVDNHRPIGLGTRLLAYTHPVQGGDRVVLLDEELRLERFASATYPIPAPPDSVFVVRDGPSGPHPATVFVNVGGGQEDLTACVSGAAGAQDAGTQDTGAQDAMTQDGWPSMTEAP